MRVHKLLSGGTLFFLHCSWFVTESGPGLETKGSRYYILEKMLKAIFHCILRQCYLFI